MTCMGGVSPLTIPFRNHRARLASMLAILSLLCVPPARAQQFQVAAQYPAVLYPQVVAVGDFNNDGKLDAVTANAGGGSLSVLLGNGDGSLGGHTEFSTGDDPLWVAMGDFNHDGNLDCAASNYTNGTVSLFLGNGDGTFKPHADLLVGDSPLSLAVGDLNGDNNPDFAVAVGIAGNTTGHDVVRVLLGNGDGTFQAHRDYAVGNSPSSVAVGDFNLDGRSDLAVTNGNDHTVSVLLGNGDGTFQMHVDYPGGGGSVVVADFNGDGKPDVAAADCCATTLAINLGNGDGTFQPSTTYFDSVAGNGTQSIAVGDFNGDGKPDVATTAVGVFLGNGNGTFQTPRVDYWISNSPNGVAAGDFNGDGKLDLVSADENGLIGVLLGNGNGTFQSTANYGTKIGPSAVSQGDFNGDGNPDMAVASSGSNVVGVFLGNSDGTFQARADYGTANAPSSVGAGDFNGDLEPDLVVTNANSNTLSVLLANANGTFRAHVDYATGSFPVSVAVGDFNGDGKLDVAATNFNDNTVSVLLGNGDGTFQSHVDYGTGGGPVSVAVGDFNGDGKLDLAVADTRDSTVSILLANGDGSFQASAAYGTGEAPSSVAVGDFDSDGKMDLAVAFTGNPDPFNFVPYGLSALLGNGDGTFQPHVDYSAGGVPLGVAVGDFDGDGKQDLAVANGGQICRVIPFEGVVCRQDFRAGVLLGNGDGTFQAPVDYVAGGQASSLAVGDFNRDGRADLAVANFLSNTVSIFLNNSKAFIEFVLSVTVAGSGGGTVTTVPAGINCGSICSASFVRGVAVTLTATADPLVGNSFGGWSGACSGTGSCVVTMTSDQTVTATFNLLPEFSMLAGAPTRNPLTPGQSSTAEIDVLPANGFNSSVSLTCLVQPSPSLAPRCSVSPSSVTPPVNGSATATLTVTTTAPTAALTVPPPGRPGPLYAWWLAIAGLALVGIASSSGQFRRRRLIPILAGSMLLAGLLFQAACGGSISGGGGRGTPPGTYTITVTGTSGSLQHSTTVTLIVQ